MSRLPGYLFAALALFSTARPLYAQPVVSYVQPAPMILPTPSVAGPDEIKAPPIATAPAPATALSPVTAESSPYGFIGGGSFYLLRPYFQGNTAYRTMSGLLSNTPTETTTNFGWDMAPSFAIWTGYQFADGLGVRARWFHFDSSSNTMDTSLGGAAAANMSIAPSQYLPTLPLPPGDKIFGSPGLLLNSGLGQDELTFTSSLRIESIDAEMTWDWDWGNWKFLAGVGGRFLYLGQTYKARLSNNLGDGVTSEVQTLDSSHNFYGGGPTVDFQANWRLGQTNLSLYAMGRGSMAIGQSTSTTTYTQNVNDPLGKTNGGAFPVISFINPSVTNSTNNIVPVTEFELGLDYGREWGRSYFFARSAVVTQTYFGAGNASRADGSNFSMFGVQFSLGLRY